MKSILNPADRVEIVARVERLTPTSERKWGQMNVNQAICHVTDPFREALGERKVKSPIPMLFRRFIKPLMLSEKPWKQGERTLRGFDQVKGSGTPPTDFERDKRSLINAINKFSIYPEPFQIHSAAGKLTREEWGQLMWKHTDHHLRQFGL
jgi:hypothetical protein